MSLKPPEGEDASLTPEEDKQAEKLLNKCKKLNPKVRLKGKTAREKQNEYKIVQNFLTQFLDSYAIIGFNTSGEEFVAMKYNSSMEGRALANLTDEFFTRHFESLTSYSSSKKDDDEDEDDEDDD
jgi:hypothetical protein